MQRNVMTDYISDELANKVKHLHSALSQANNIIDTLEKENNRLYDVLISLASNDKTGYVLDNGAFNESVCAA